MLLQEQQQQQQIVVDDDEDEMGRGPASVCLHSHSNPHLLICTFSRLCDDGPLPAALALLPNLAAAGVRTDPISLCRLIKLCVRHGKASDGRLIHRHVSSAANSNGEGAPHASLFVSMHAKFGLLDDALELLGRMPERNVVSWTTVISALASAGGRKQDSFVK
ncbi:hypothetical protein QYE76_008974 [Lolium multiflorum]|uniref:Pentatricopeptide repeat-containing protein n=1 Tax=Lolium multiflorum TaxID=4521 RepID=A0AAD8TUA7_LOLMU|nr:hypothetical protein QYE76_008962 [Lolium multiflorum]KAK1692277.1 hypothetical protein QYE76_008974 [Lolium multiflorum]